jgi:hypothetical protein
LEETEARDGGGGALQLEETEMRDDDDGGHQWVVDLHWAHCDGGGHCDGGDVLVVVVVELSWSLWY